MLEDTDYKNRIKVKIFSLFDWTFDEFNIDVIGTKARAKAVANEYAKGARKFGVFTWTHIDHLVPQ